VDTSVVPAHQWHAERKEKFTLFSDHNGSLLKAGSILQLWHADEAAVGS